MSKLEDKKAALVLPGAYKKKKPTAKLKDTGKPYTALTAADVRTLLGKDKSKEIVIDLSDDYFQLENDDFLVECGEVRSLDLSRNCLTKFVNGGSLGKLKHLVLDQNQLDQVSFAGLKSLIGLHLSRNRIQALNDMSDLAKLQFLDMSGNRITRGWNQLAKLKALKVLDLGNCRIDLPASEFNSVLLVHFQAISKLQFINFSGNPVETHIPDFKYLIIHSFPELKYYNWDPVTKEDRTKAESLAKTQKWASVSTPVVGLKKDTAKASGANTRRQEPRSNTRPKKDQGANDNKDGDASDDGDLDGDIQDLVQGLDNNDADSTNFLSTLDEILDGEPVPNDMTFTISNFNIDELLDTDIDSMKTPRSGSRATPALPSGASPAQPKTMHTVSELDAAENELLDMLSQQLTPPTTTTGGNQASATKAPSAGDDSLLDDIVQALITGNEVPAPSQKSTKAANSVVEISPAWDADISELKMENMLGIGSYSETYTGKWDRAPDAVIIKKLKDNNPNIDPQESTVRFREETEQLMKLSHQNLVPIIGACATTDAKYVICRFVEGKSLHNYLRENTPLTSTFILRVARAVTAAIDYLHKQGVLHGAIKANNVLIDTKTNEVYVNDYGYMDIKDWVDMPEAHPQFMAPELINQEAYAEKIDIYSFGCLLYELITAREPFEDKEVDVIIDLVRNSEHPVPPPSTPEALMRLLNGCWSRDPTQRPAFSDIDNYLKQPDVVLLPPNVVFPLSLTAAPVVVTPTPTPAPTPAATPAPQQPVQQPAKPVIPTQSQPQPTSKPSFRDKTNATPAAPLNVVRQSSTINSDPVTVPVFRSTTLNPANQPKPQQPPQSQPQHQPHQQRPSQQRQSQPQPQQQQPPKRKSSVPPDPDQPVIQTGQPAIHRSYMNESEHEKLQTILSKIHGMLTSSVSAIQIKAMKTLYAVINTPGRIYEIAKNEDVLVAIITILRQTGQIGKFDLIEQCIMLLTDLAAHPIMAELLPEHKLLLHITNILTNFMDDHALMLLVVKLIAALVINYPPNAEASLNAGILLPLINMLKTKSQGCTLQMAALTALCPLLESDLVLDKFLQANTFKLLLGMEQTNISRLKLYALEALVNFLNDPNLEESMEPLKLKERTLKMSESPNALLREVGLSGVCRMAAFHNDTLLTEADKKQILNMCLGIISNDSDAQILELYPKALRTLSILVEDESCLAAFLEDQRSLSAVLPLLSSPTDKVRVHALDIVGFAIANPNGKNTLVTLGGFVSLVSCLDHWSSKIRQSALSSVSSLIRQSKTSEEEGSVLNNIMDSDIISLCTSVLAYIDNVEELYLAADVIFEIAEKKNTNFYTEMRKHGTIGTLCTRLAQNIPAEGVSHNNPDDQADKGAESDAKDKLTEAIAYALASLTADATNRQALLQEGAVATMLQQLRNPHVPTVERVTWTLGNIALDDGGRELICTDEHVLPLVNDLLLASDETILSAALRVLLAIAKQADYLPYIKAPDPQLERLKALKQHSSPKISQIASKLTDVLSKV